MTCPRCRPSHDDTKVIRTIPGLVVSRQHRCEKCGRRWWTDQRLRSGSIEEPRACASPSTPPAQGPSSPLVSDPSLSLVVDPVSDPDQTRARKSMPGAAVFPVVGDKDVREWAIAEDEYATLREAYPDLDVEGEIRKALAWVKASPGNRKTGKGMLKFLTGWMGRNQNRGGARNTNGAGRDVKVGWAGAEVKKRAAGAVEDF